MQFGWILNQARYLFSWRRALQWLVSRVTRHVHLRTWSIRDLLEWLKKILSHHDGHLEIFIKQK